MKKTFILALMLCLLPVLSLLAQGINYKAQSVFLFNFARYAEWPVETETIRFGILGKTDVFKELDEVLKQKNINGKKCIIEKMTRLDDAAQYHIIFVADNESGKLANLLTVLGDKSTLVVTERDNLVKKGAAISFIVTDDHKLHFQLNKEVLERLKIQMASSLRSLALASN